MARPYVSTASAARARGPYRRGVPAPEPSPTPTPQPPVPGRPPRSAARPSRGLPARAAALVRAAHAGPTVAVTGFALAFGVLGTDLGPGRLVLLVLVVLTGQLTIGWTNDWADAARDAAAGRADKPVAAGRGLAPGRRDRGRRSPRGRRSCCRCCSAGCPAWCTSSSSPRASPTTWGSRARCSARCPTRSPSALLPARGHAGRAAAAAWPPLGGGRRRRPARAWRRTSPTPSPTPRTTPGPGWSGCRSGSGRAPRRCWPCSSSRWPRSCCCPAPSTAAGSGRWSRPAFLGTGVLVAVLAGAQVLVTGWAGGPGPATTGAPWAGRRSGSSWARPGSSSSGFLAS